MTVGCDFEMLGNGIDVITRHLTRGAADYHTPGPSMRLFDALAQYCVYDTILNCNLILCGLNLI